MSYLTTKATVAAVAVGGAAYYALNNYLEQAALENAGKEAEVRITLR